MLIVVIVNIRCGVIAIRSVLLASVCLSGFLPTEWSCTDRCFCLGHACDRVDSAVLQAQFLELLTVG